MIGGLIRYWKSKSDPIKYARSLGVRLGTECKLVSVGGATFGSEPYLITIGNHVEIAGEVSFLTHDGGAWLFRDEFPDLDVFGTIVIGNNVFIGRRAIILPGTVIGDNCVIGAGSVVKGALASDGVYAGVPAKRLRELGEYKAKLLENNLKSKQLGALEKRRFLEEHFGLPR